MDTLSVLIYVILRGTQLWFREQNNVGTDSKLCDVVRNGQGAVCWDNSGCVL